jgi:hypothetical protein
MTRMVRLILVFVLIAMVAGVAPPGSLAGAQSPEASLDLAAVPLPVQELPESGFQVMSGGYLDLESAAAWIAEPRERSQTAVGADLAAEGWMQAYALDLVLLEDRAWAESDILTMVQTTVHLFADPNGASAGFDVLADFSGRGDADDVGEGQTGIVTVRLPSQSGDTLRSVVLRDHVVLEVMTLEGFGFVDVDTHNATVTATISRLDSVRENETIGLVPRAARLTDGEALGDLQSLEQSGVHQVYRIRDGVTQPAAGELDEPEPDGVAPGLSELYHGSESVDLGLGFAFMSSWIAGFETEDDAGAFMETIASAGPSEWIVDPYFPIADGEQATSQGITGVYRVTGLVESQPYSGTLEIRQHGSYVVAIGFRAAGNTLPPVDVTSRVMDHQLGCLDVAAACPAIDLGELLTPPMATPVVPASAQGIVVSNEFGWSLQVDEGAWEIREQFEEQGYDFVELQSGRSLVTLESVINQHGDVQQCVIDELDMLQELESSAVIDLGSDIDERPAGMERGHAWAIYTVEPLADERADQEYVIRIDCYSLIEGGANLVMTHRSPRDAWAEERAKGDVVRGGLALPSGVRAVPNRNSWALAA